MSDIVPTYKGRLFRFIFGRPDRKDWTLSLYNAVNGTSYSNPDDITITTVMDALYMSMKNDLSFLITDTMNFYEQQATYNPNMPMRFLIYAGMVYSRYIEQPENKINIYSSTQQLLPAPRFVCFYNGLRNQDDKVMLRLKDAFPKDSNPDVDLTVTMLNVNYGRNRELLEACAPLRDYSWLVAEIRNNKENGMELEDAVEKAVNDLREDSPIKPLLLDNKSEVTRMCITEYDEARTMELFKEEGRMEGEKTGIGKGESKLGSLITKLKVLGRIDDAFQAASDPAYREKLYKEFKMA